MNRDTAVKTWREVCGSDTVMAMGVVTGRMLEDFATRIAIEERKRLVEVSTQAAQAELERLRAENAALKLDLQYARDGLTKGRTRMREDNERLRAALLRCARQAEALKRECGSDPEGTQAVRNGKYQAISTAAHIALGTIKGPAPSATVATVTECEACFTPDVCQLRGTCDHYAAEQLRIAKGRP